MRRGGRTRDPYLLGMRRGIAKRLLLGLLITLVAILAGWTLVPPEVGTDAATVYWYTH